jgi:hypothetical protein
MTILMLLRVPALPGALAVSVVPAVHCNENSICVHPEKELRGVSPNFHIHVFVSNLYIFQGSVHIFSCIRIGRPIVEIYTSITDTRRKLGLRPRSFFSGKICFQFAVLCHGSVIGVCLYWCPSAVAGVPTISGVPAVVYVIDVPVVSADALYSAVADVLALYSIPAEVPAIASVYFVDFSTISAVPCCYLRTLL